MDIYYILYSKTTKMKSKSIILFKDNIGEYLYDFGIGEDFLNKTPFDGEDITYSKMWLPRALSRAPFLRRGFGHM